MQVPGGLQLRPDKWISLLDAYGPMGLTVFFTIVFLLGRTFKPKDDKERKRHAIQQYAFLAVIIIFAGLGAFLFYKKQFPPEHVAVGTINNLRNPEIVETDDELFLRRHTTAGNDFKYDWRLITSKPLTGTSIELILQHHEADTFVEKYELPITKAFYDDVVTLDYDRNSKSLIVMVGDKQTTLPAHVGLAGGSTTSPREFGVVYAASSPKASPEELIRALDANDPLTRKNARQSLAAYGLAAIPAISKALTDPASSYRLRLGVLATLHDIGSLAEHSLSNTVRCSIQETAKNDPDPAIRSQADLVFANISRSTNCQPNTRGKTESEDTSSAEDARLVVEGQHYIDILTAYLDQYSINLRATNGDILFPNARLADSFVSFQGSDDYIRMMNYRNNVEDAIYHVSPGAITPIASQFYNIVKDYPRLSDRDVSLFILIKAMRDDLKDVVARLESSRKKN